MGVNKALESLDAYLIEGVVEVDPDTGGVHIRTEDSDGQPVKFDPLPVLKELRGQEVRVTIASFTSIEMLQHIAEREASEDSSVVGN